MLVQTYSNQPNNIKMCVENNLSGDILSSTITFKMLVMVS